MPQKYVIVTFKLSGGASAHKTSKSDSACLDTRDVSLIKHRHGSKIKMSL